MKKQICAAALALCLSLAACAPTSGASSRGGTSSSGRANVSPAASHASSASAVSSGQAAQLLDLPYEKIEPVADYATPYPYLACGFDGSETAYYTMCKDGLWGLMRADFTVVLECRAPQPVARCNLGHWFWGYDGMSWDELDAVTARLSEAGDGALEPGHGGGVSQLFYWDMAKKTCGLYISGEDSAQNFPITAGLTALYGEYLPVQLSSMAEGERIPGPYPEKIDNAFCYNFAGPAGADAPHLLTGEAYEAVGWFREGLGSIYKDGKTAYLNAEGQAVTDFLYDGVWAIRYATQSILDEDTDAYVTEIVHTYPGSGYPLAGGYAPVCRDGLWGFIDASGAEAVPCRYDYACPTPDGRALVRENSVWSIVEPAALAA